MPSASSAICRRCGSASKRRRPGRRWRSRCRSTAIRLSGRYRGLDVRIERATVFAHARAALAADALKVRLDPPKGSGTPVAGWMPPWPRSRTLRATAEVSGPPGAWKLAVTTTGAKINELIDDLVFVFELRARKT